MEELLAEWVPRLYRFARRLTSDFHAAEDLVQETALRAWRERERLRDPRAARVWLFRIAVNLWRDWLRRGRSPVARARPLASEPLDDAPAPDRVAADQDELQRALAALDSLPSRQREVLYLNACEGLSLAEIAGVLDISTDAAKASLSVARNRLRELLPDLASRAP